MSPDEVCTYSTYMKQQCAIKIIFGTVDLCGLVDWHNTMSCVRCVLRSVALTDKKNQ